jgi:hypothetical protein
MGYDQGSLETVPYGQAERKSEAGKFGIWHDSVPLGAGNPKAFSRGVRVLIGQFCGLEWEKKKRPVSQVAVLAKSLWALGLVNNRPGDTPLWETYACKQIFADVFADFQEKGCHDSCIELLGH